MGSFRSSLLTCIAAAALALPNCYGGDSDDDDEPQASGPCQAACDNANQVCTDGEVDHAQCLEQCPGLGVSTRDCLANTSTCLGVLDCLTGGGPMMGAGGGGGAAGQPATSLGEPPVVEWVTVAGSEAIERVEQLAVAADGSVAAFAELPQGGEPVFNAGTPEEFSVTGRAMVIRYTADGVVSWATPVTANENLFPESIAILPDGRVAAAGIFKHGGSTQPYEIIVGSGADLQTFSFPRPADTNSYLPFVAVFALDGRLDWLASEGSPGVLLVDDTRVLLAGPTLTVYDHSGVVQEQRRLISTELAYQSVVTAAAWLPGGGFIAAGAFGADVTVEPDSAEPQLITPEGENDGLMLWYGDALALENVRVFPEQLSARREAVAVGALSDGSIAWVYRRRIVATPYSFIERLTDSGVAWSLELGEKTGVFGAHVSGDTIDIAGTIDVSDEFPVLGDQTQTIAVPGATVGGFVARYDAAGAALFIEPIPTPGYVFDVAPFSDGALAIVGDFTETSVFGTRPDAPQHTSQGSSDLFAARLLLP